MFLNLFFFYLSIFYNYVFVVFATKEEIEEQIASTKVSKLLAGYRGEAPCDVEEVKEAIKRVARLTLDFPEISELDINPIFVYEEGSSALDIKIKL